MYVIIYSILIEQHVSRSEPCDVSNGGRGLGNTVSVRNGGRGPGGHKKISTKSKDVVNGCNKEDGTTPDMEAMLLTVEALSAQLQEQTKLCKEQVGYWFLWLLLLVTMVTMVTDYYGYSVYTCNYCIYCTVGGCTP